MIALATDGESKTSRDSAPPEQGWGGLGCFGSHVSFAVAVGLLLVSFTFVAHAQIPQRTFGMPGQGSCPPTPPVIGPWNYVGEDTSISPAGLVFSFGEYVDWYDNVYTPHNSWCSGTFQSTQPLNPPVADLYTYGVDVVKEYSALFPGTAYTNTGCTQSWTNRVHMVQRRSVFCLPPDVLHNQASAGIGPYCADPSPLQKKLYKVPGRCCGVCKGDPCDVLNGNKYQSEIDYASSGANPLRFERSYNSMAAYNYGNGTAVLGTTYGFVTAVGVGWMANYFQWLSVQSITDSSTTYAVVNAFRPDGRV